MDPNSILARFPPQITVRASDGPRFYARDPGLDAQIGMRDPRRPVAVYREEGKGAPVVPTARVFVLCRGAHTVTECREEIEGAGFEIERVPKSAPHGAWLIARSGEAIDAIVALELLAQIEQLEVVQPELVGELEKR